MKYFKIISAAFLALLVVACFDEPGTDILFDDSHAYLEINEATTAGGSTIAKAYSRVNNGVGVRDSVRVNLAGAHRSTPVSVTFQIDPAGTAIAGTHYNMITTGTTVTIPPNSSYAYIYFEVLDDNIEPLTNWDLKFELTGGDLPVHPTYSILTRRIQTLCAFARTNFLGVYDTDEPGYHHYDVTFTEDPDDANTIVNDNFWDSGVSIKYVLNANCRYKSLQRKVFSAPWWEQLTGHSIFVRPKLSNRTR